MIQHTEIKESDASALLSGALSSSDWQSWLSNLQRPSESIIHQALNDRSALFATMLELSTAHQQVVSVPLTYGNRHRTQEISLQFRELAASWKKQSRTSSFSSNLATHPSYQRIIGLGPAAIPLILAELEKDLDHWFWALKAISGEDPVPPESRGKMREMADAWLKWGRDKGHAW